MTSLLCFLLYAGLFPGASPQPWLSSPPSSRPASLPSASSNASLQTKAASKPASPPPSSSLLPPSRPSHPTILLLPTWRDLLGRSEKGQAIPTSQPTSGLPLSQASFWIQLLVFFFLLGAFVSFIYLSMRFLASRFGIQPSSSTRLLAIQERLAIEPKKALFLVEVAGQYLLLASHEHGVTLLQTLSPDQVQKARTSAPFSQVSFWSLLRGKTPSQAQNPSPPSDPSPIPTHFEVVSDGRNKPPSSSDAG